MWEYIKFHSKLLKRKKKQKFICENWKSKKLPSWYQTFIFCLILCSEHEDSVRLKLNLFSNFPYKYFSSSNIHSLYCNILINISPIFCQNFPCFLKFRQYFPNSSIISPFSLFRLLKIYCSSFKYNYLFFSKIIWNHSSSTFSVSCMIFPSSVTISTFIGIKITFWI